MKGTGTLTSWKYKIPSGVKYVSLTMYDRTNLIDYIKAGTVSASMVVDGAEEPSSSSTTTTTTTPVVTDEYKYIFRNTDFDFDIVSSSLTCNDYTDYNTPGLEIKNIAKGNTLAFTTKTSIASGIYIPTLYARAYSGRAKFDVYINDTLIVSALDTSTSVKGNGSHMPFELPQVTFNSDTVVTIKFVAVSSGTFYPDDIVFKKIGDANPTAIDISMKTGAALRLGTENGLRFYTQVDANKLNALQVAGYTVEMGTLITPVDILGSEELTLESTVAKLDVKYSAFDKNGNIIYYENGDTFVGSIVKIKESSTSWSATSGNITREYVGRGYVKLTKDGETTVVYADYADGNIVNNTRSLQYIAQAYRNDVASNYYMLDYDFQLLVDKWAESKKS